MSQQNKEFAKTNKQLESTVKNLWKDVRYVLADSFYCEKNIPTCEPVGWNCGHSNS